MYIGFGDMGRYVRGVPPRRGTSLAFASAMPAATRCCSDATVKTSRLWHEPCICTWRASRSHAALQNCGPQPCFRAYFDGARRAHVQLCLAPGALPAFRGASPSRRRPFALVARALHPRARARSSTSSPTRHMRQPVTYAAHSGHGMMVVRRSPRRSR